MMGRTWTAAAAAVFLGGWLGAAAQTLPAGKADATVVAVVNGVSITRAELDAVVKTSGPSAVAVPETQRRQRQLEALALLIDNVLMRQFLAKHTPAVSPQEVKRLLAEMEAGLAKQGKSVAEHCHDTNQTPAQLEAAIADHMRWTAYCEKYLTEAVVRKYYADNKDFFDKVTVKASHIVLRLPPGAAAADKEKARAKLQEIRGRLTADPKLKFADMARKYSQDPQAADGGSLGEFPRKWVFDESFSRAAFATPVGQVSDVVETEYGLHLIHVTDRSPGTPSDYARIKEAVREFCSEEVRQEILRRARQVARDQIRVQLP